MKFLFSIAILVIAVFLVPAAVYGAPVGFEQRHFNEAT
jgi:hypothetical protein